MNTMSAWQDVIDKHMYPNNRKGKSPRKSRKTRSVVDSLQKTKWRQQRKSRRHSPKQTSSYIDRPESPVLKVYEDDSEVENPIINKAREYNIIMNKHKWYVDRIINIYKSNKRKRSLSDVDGEKNE